jgi:hypothetical protein
MLIHAPAHRASVLQAEFARQSDYGLAAQRTSQKQNYAERSDGCSHPGEQDTRLMLHDGEPAWSDMFEQHIGCFGAAAPGRRVAAGISIRGSCRSWRPQDGAPSWPLSKGHTECAGPHDARPIQTIDPARKEGIPGDTPCPRPPMPHDG